MDEEYLNPAETGKRLGMTTGQLAQLRFMGTGPKFIKPSERRVLYRWSDVEEWLKSREQIQTGARVSASA